MACLAQKPTYSATPSPSVPTLEMQNCASAGGLDAGAAAQGYPERQNTMESDKVKNAFFTANRQRNVFSSACQKTYPLSEEPAETVIDVRREAFRREGLRWWDVPRAQCRLSLTALRIASVTVWPQAGK